jgi:hypothetical protein
MSNDVRAARQVFVRGGFDKDGLTDLEFVVGTVPPSRMTSLVIVYHLYLGNLRKKVMEWFSQKTSIAGVQIPNWMVVLGAIIVILIIYRSLH